MPPRRRAKNALHYCTDYGDLQIMISGSWQVYIPANYRLFLDSILLTSLLGIYTKQ
jgi:hypothetical protein